MIQVYYNNVLHDVLDNEIEYSRLHRENDEPAIIYENGSKFWYKNGQRHREGDEPAYISACGGKLWYKNGQPHREGDLPAKIYDDGSKCWYKNGQIHREGDEPAEIYANGSEYWYKNNKFYYKFNFQKLISIQLLLIFLFNIKKNKRSFHPNYLIGKLIKIDIEKMISNISDI